jgi:hypothetical protein
MIIFLTIVSDCSLDFDVTSSQKNSLCWHDQGLVEINGRIISCNVRINNIMGMTCTSRPLITFRYVLIITMVYIITRQPDIFRIMGLRYREK